MHDPGRRDLCGVYRPRLRRRARPAANHYIYRDMIRWAIADGCKWFRSSGLNYDPKLHLRHTLDPIDLYVRHTSEPVNAVMKRLLPILGSRRATTRRLPGSATITSSGRPLERTDVVALGDQIRRAPEIEIGECGAEVGHERLDPSARARCTSSRPCSTRPRRCAC